MVLLLIILLSLGGCAVKGNFNCELKCTDCMEVEFKCKDDREIEPPKAVK